MKLLTTTTLQEGTVALRRKDPALREWIDRVGPVRLRRNRHHFGSLCRSICSQQLAARAAATIHARLLELFAPARNPSPERLLELDTASLRACGLSERKASYLQALASAFHDGRLGKLRFSRLSDQDIVDALVEVPGIGQWTAEMFLIFSVGRLDVFSVGDLALRNAVERVEGRKLKPAKIERIAERWSPYRSVACLFLWRIAHWSDE